MPAICGWLWQKAKMLGARVRHVATSLRTSIVMTLSPTAKPFQVISAEALLARSRYFAQVQVWPRQNYLDASAWLSNFNDDEKKHAIYLLNSFVYYSEELINRLFVGAIQGLSRTVVTSKKSFFAARGEWTRFLASVLIARVTGENPSDADSGFLFVRKARDLLGIPESQLVPHDKIVEQVLQKNPSTPVVFVDDFVGSGNQFKDMWHRKYTVPGSSQKLSLADVSRSHRNQPFYYCPLVCTEDGLSTIRTHCPQVIVKPAHLLDARYNVFHADSIVWPPQLRDAGIEMLRTASQRAGIPDRGGLPGDWRGFRHLGLSLAFSHGVPDATLPIFTWSQNGWHPLLRKQ